MHRARNLEQTPRLVDPDVADEVGFMHAGIGVTDEAYRANGLSGRRPERKDAGSASGREVVYANAVERFRVV